MKKLFSIILFVVALACLVSCRGVPFFMVQERAFKYDDEKASALREAVGNIDCTDKASLTIEDTKNSSETVMLYVNGEDVAFYEYDGGSEKKAYCNGVFYNYDETSKTLQKEEKNFNTEAYEISLRFGYSLLRTLLERDAKEFKVDSATSTVLDKEDAVFVHIVPKDKNKMLGEIRKTTGPITSDLKVTFTYVGEDFSEITLSWIAGSKVYKVSFLVDELPGEIEYAIDSLPIDTASGK
jgi:hypothetical protein